MPTMTFTPGDDTFTANTDENFELYFLGGDDVLVQDHPEGAGYVYAEMGTGNDRVILRSGEGANIYGNDGNDRFDLHNPGGENSVDGGTGNDSFNVQAGAGGHIHATGEEGSDTFRILGDVTAYLQLAGGVGNDVFYSYAGAGMVGSGSAVYGEAGNDRFYGFLEGVTVYGGTGDDVYRIDPFAPAAFYEYANEGIDGVQVAVGADYTLGENIENISVQNFATSAPVSTPDQATLTGNALNNRITGSWANETMNGLDGNDVLFGGGGDDTLIGGNGDDLYYIDSDGDLTIEGAAAGYDTVRADLRSEVNLTNGTTADDTATYTLQANVERLIMQADINHDINGNELDNVIYGRNAVDTINGLAGNDTLYAGDGDDVLRGQEGNDVLFGGNGNDILRGGLGDDLLQGNAGDDNMAGNEGNDTYFVDSAGDVVIEGAGEGDDTVVTTMSSYTLTANVENAQGYGTPVTLTGNESNNRLTGTEGDDTLIDTSPTGGSDTFVGLGGADTIISADDNVTDTFVYTDRTDSTAAAYDRVFGVEGGAGGDLFDLTGVDAIEGTAANEDFDYIGEAMFTGKAGELRHDGDFIYGDTNGDGVADFVIEYDTGTGPDLTAANFVGIVPETPIV